MVGGSRHDRLERLIDEVGRGGRDLASIRDDQLRDAVRIALQMHATAPGGLDAATRARMKNRVLRASQPRRISLRDRVFLAFDMLARPAPYIVRGVATVVIVVGLAGGATVASADTLPDDPLYAVKLAGEELRLALAATSEDRASVELSIAEHRLSEAERLAATGRVDDAIMASSSYRERVARAAAQLSALETAEQTTSSTTSALLTQLDTRFTAQRARALTLSVRLNTDPATAGGGQVLAAVAAPSLAPGRTQAERVAETAAVVAEALARVA